jgi:phage virion morphogenesis protein
MLTIQVDDRALRDVLATLTRQMSNLTPVMNSIGMEMEGRVSGRFQSRTDPNGQAWAPWAPATLKYYPQKGNRKLLDRYGDMLLSLSHQATKDSVRIGFGKAYSTYHEFGTKTMPRRGLLFADPEAGTMGAGDEAAVLDIIGLYLAPD